MLHLAVAGHPLGMGLGCFLKRLVVGAGRQVVLFSLGVEPAEHIADEGGFLGGGVEASRNAQHRREEEKRPHLANSFAFFRAAAASSFLRSFCGAKPRFS
jgi:hypothetical protein